MMAEAKRSRDQVLRRSHISVARSETVIPAKRATRARAGTHGSLRRWRRSAAEAVPEVDPLRIVALDQGDLPRARPTLQYAMSRSWRRSGRRGDRKSVGWGKGGYVRVYLGG